MKSIKILRGKKKKAKQNKKETRSPLFSLKAQSELESFLCSKLMMENSSPLFLSLRHSSQIFLQKMTERLRSVSPDLARHSIPQNVFPHTEHSISGHVINHREMNINMLISKPDSLLILEKQ